MKTWKKPEAKLEIFQANEVIAACYNLQCLVPYDNAGKDPANPNNSNNKHTKDHCGAADGTELITNENNEITYIYHGKHGGSNGACAVFEDESYSTPKTKVTAGEMVYWITTNDQGTMSWRHHGTAVLTGNHS